MLDALTDGMASCSSSGVAQMARAGGAAESRKASATRGRELARLLDPGSARAGHDRGQHYDRKSRSLPYPLLSIIVICPGDDFAVTAGWGHFGRLWLGQARDARARAASNNENTRAAETPTLCQTVICCCSAKATFDIYLNEKAYWRQRSRSGLELQTRRLSGAQEMAVLSRT